MKTYLIALGIASLLLFTLIRAYNVGYTQGRHDGWWSATNHGLMY